MNTLLSDQAARNLFYLLLAVAIVFLLDMIQPILAPFVYCGFVCIFR